MLHFSLTTTRQLCNSVSHNRHWPQVTAATAAVRTIEAESLRLRFRLNALSDERDCLRAVLNGKRCVPGDETRSHISSTARAAVDKSKSSAIDEVVVASNENVDGGNRDAPDADAMPSWAALFTRASQPISESALVLQK